MPTSGQGHSVFPSSQPGPFIAHLASLIRLRNQTGTLLLLLPSLWALVLASNGNPSPGLLVIFTLGALVMRSAGVIMNDLADQSFDRQITRTKTRPLASGDLRPIHALLFLGGLLVLAVGLLAFLNRLTIWLSPIALGLAAFYPFTKRFFHVPQFFLGLAFGWGAVMAWAATRNQLEPSAWLLFAATICWALAYDTIYALQDRNDDIQVGVKSSAILFGSHVWIAVGIIEIVMVAFLGVAGWLEHLNLAFYGVLAGLAGFLSQQVWRLRTEVNPSEAFAMFKQHVGVGLVILGGIWLGPL
ncbi:MAG: 4-hydroxybenzoate octaprenyltransferase [Nitrospirales bacterium]